ncbi:MAG: hypothetical protein WC437_05630 [Patescibacteria group bacterium]
MKKRKNVFGRKFCCVPDMVLCLSGKEAALKVLGKIWDKRHKKPTASNQIIKIEGVKP